MRVLLINQYYPPDTAATGQLLRDLANGLIKEGHEVHVLCSRRMYGGGETSLSAEEILDGAHMHRVQATGFGRKVTLGRLIDYLSFYVSAAWHALFLPRMDVSLCLTTPPFIAVLCLLLRWVKGTKMVLWSMDVYPEVAVAYGYLKQKSLTRRAMTALSRHLYHASSCVVSLGEVMTERLMEAGVEPGRIVTVHNWAPGASFAQPALADSFLATSAVSQERERAAVRAPIPVEGVTDYRSREEQAPVSVEQTLISES